MNKKQLTDNIRALKGKLSRTQILKKFRPYVHKCTEISTFKELKEIVFEHIPRKNPFENVIITKKFKHKGKKEAYQTEDGSWKKRRAKAERKFDPQRDRKSHKFNTDKSKSTRWTPTYNTICTYVLDDSTKRIHKIVCLGSMLHEEINKLGITKWGFKNKYAYKAQFKAKPKKTVKKIHLSLPKAVRPEREFIKGVGWVLTEKGKKQKRDSYYTKRIKTRGGVRLVKRSHGLHLVETTIHDYNIKDREIRTITPPKENTSKRYARIKTKQEKEERRLVNLEKTYTKNRIKRKNKVNSTKKYNSKNNIWRT